MRRFRSALGRSLAPLILIWLMACTSTEPPPKAADTADVATDATDAASAPVDAAGVPDDASSDLGEPPVTPAELDTSFVQLATCATQWAATPFAWSTRPSSGRTCAAYPGAEVSGEVRYRCLPWEWCDVGFLGMPGDGPDKWQHTGSLRCMRHCGEAKSCPSDTSCLKVSESNGDMATEHEVCAVPAAPTAFPIYAPDAPPPAEGGLGCWTKLAQADLPNYGMAMARVGAHIYLLLAGGQSGSEASPTTPTASHILVHVPLSAQMTATDYHTIEEVKPSSAAFKGLVASGEHLVAFRRPASPKQEKGSPPLDHTVFAGKPQADGQVTLTDTGLVAPLAYRANATLTGTRHGCLLVRHGKDLARMCFVHGAKGFTKELLPLQLPTDAQSALAATMGPSGGGDMTNLAPWRAAVSDKWIVLATGTVCAGEPARLHVAPFDRASNAVVGDWTTSEVLQGWTGHKPPNDMGNLCNPLGPVLVSGDIVVASGMTTRLTAGQPGPWLAATIVPRAFGYFSGWDAVDGLLVAAYRVGTKGKTVPVAIVANRLLW